MRKALYDSKLANPLKTRVFAAERSLARKDSTPDELTSALPRTGMYNYTEIKDHSCIIMQNRRACPTTHIRGHNTPYLYVFFRLLR